MTEKELYQQWLEHATEDADLQTELKGIAGDDAAISDRFYRDLEFGTGGLRGVIGAGTYRMNIYTVRRATQGLANYVKSAFEAPSVAISYDSRIKSDVFAKAAAEVLAANGIRVHIYTELMPTPMLSYAVRAQKCSAGIMVTASHNPAKYNGYKVYGSDGCQMTIDAANAVLAEINALDMFTGVKHTNFDEAMASGMISYTPQSVIDAYYQDVLKQSLNPELCAKSGLKIVYTPLNGTGNKPVRHILSAIGIKDVTVVPEQENPDGNFTTCPYPNPEIREALECGLKLCREVKPDLLLATDPDADRVGIAVPDGDDYALFSGNEVGAMLLEYICQQRTEKGTMPKNPIAVKTIVTTDIVNAIGQGIRRGDYRRADRLQVHRRTDRLPRSQGRRKPLHFRFRRKLRLSGWFLCPRQGRSCCLHADLRNGCLLPHQGHFHDRSPQAYVREVRRICTQPAQLHL